MDKTDALVSVSNLNKHFPLRRRSLLGPTASLKAVNDISFSIAQGEVLAVVGESGSGKSTLGRLLLRLLKPSSGRIVFGDRDIAQAPERDLRPLRRQMQIIFQDPFSSLNPHMRVGDALREVLDVHGLAASRSKKDAHVAALLEKVGLRPSAMNRFPHEFSGGQRQRIGIARAIACNPSFLVADEAVSALDVSVQAQIVNLLCQLQASMGLAMLFISHNLSVVRYVADRTAVMYLGRIVEIGPTEQVFPQSASPLYRGIAVRRTIA